ncbi:MAG: carboxymuconolactone decarboxylase family protein [Eubacteriales bacterium]|nr:carboxymuconolactone decarboxylase family protein [Eubacteriales bacterium]
METAMEKLAREKEKWGRFAELSPDVIGAFGQMRAASCKEGGVLDFKTLELISVAVAVARKCEPCMLSHVELAVEAGCTREELAAALNTTILLCGGPSWAYSAMALDAFDQMSAAKGE